MKNGSLFFLYTKHLVIATSDCHLADERNTHLQRHLTLDAARFWTTVYRKVAMTSERWTLCCRRRKINFFLNGNVS